MNTVVNGNKVKVHYVGTFTDGTEFDSSYKRGSPIEFEVGSGQMISGFDKGVVGMTAGEKKNLELGIAEAYGPRHDEAIQQVPKGMFPEEFKFTEGATITGNTPDGQPFMAKVLTEQDTSVTLDFNHPMAGRNLKFEVELVEIVNETDGD